MPERRKKVLLVNNMRHNMLTIVKNQIYSKHKIDIFFPMVHGTGGEDGTIQGLLETINKPYVGCNVESSAICMDKVLTKQILLSNSIKTTNFFYFTNHEWKTKKSELIRQVSQNIKFPCFIKASNLGSSVGVYKVKNKTELIQKINSAFKFTKKVLVEEAVLNPEEIEVSVLENKKIIVSNPGRIIPSDEFYSYKAKYIDGKSIIEIPYKRANKNKKLLAEIQSTSLKSFITLNCSGMARIDFLFGSTKTNKIPRLYLSEVNTIPGFTEISMYPKLLNANGISLKEIISKLIKESENRYKEKEKLITNFV